MKIAILMGRGIEGCGVTQFIVQFKKWMDKHGVENDIFAWSDKKWGRAKSTNFDFIDVHGLHEGDNLEKLANRLNSEYSYIFVGSVPSKTHPQPCIDSFLELIKRLTPTKCVIQLDHKIQSIRRNANFMEICHLCDRFVTYCDASAFSMTFKKEYSEEEFVKKYVQIVNPVDMTVYDKYRKQKHLNRVSYLGRFATFKDPGRISKIREDLRRIGVQAEMVGIERSLGSLSLLRDEDADGHFHDKPYINFIDSLKNDVPYEKRNPDQIYVFGPYVQADAFEHVSNSMFGAEFFNLKSGTYGTCTEFAMGEIVGLGCIPLFDYNWAEEVYCHENGKATDKRFIDVKYSGLYLKKDLSNLNEIISEMKKIVDSPELQEKYRKTSFEVMKKHLDPEGCMSTMFERLGLKF